MLRHVFRRVAAISSVAAIPQVNDTVSTGSQKPTSGWAKVYEIFTVDEFGSNSPQLNTIIQTTFYTGFFGCCYGGFIHSREAFLRFMERNQATKFTDHFEAKKKLQDFMIVNFAKGAFKWGWRLALFSGLYISFVTILSAYEGDSKLWHFCVGGLFSGAIYRINLGLRGVIVGGTLGVLIGLFAGSLTTLLLKLTGSSLDDIHDWHSEIAEARSRRPPSKENQHELLAAHDERLSQGAVVKNPVFKNETSPSKS